MESFEEIYGRMMDNYNKMSGNYPSEASDMAIRLKLLAGEIQSCEMNLDFVKNQMFLHTAVGEYLDYHGKQRGLTRKQAVKAKGMANFGTAGALTYDVTVPKGTVVATTGENPVMFETDENAVIKSGQARVSVSCTALTGGSNGNVKSGTITVIVTPKADIVSVTNTQFFYGGTDTESDDDFRKRIEDSLINVSNGMNTAYYKKLALSVEGVGSVGIIPLNRGAGTLDVYISGEGTTASTALVAKVQSLINKKREINTDVLVKSASAWNFTLSLSITVKPGYDFNELKEKCTAVLKEYVLSLGIGTPVYIADLSELIYHIEGIYNHSFSTSDRFPNQTVFPNVTNVNITEGSR